MVLVFWALTPVAAALFNTTFSQQTLPITVANTARPVSSDETQGVLNGNIFNAAYAAKWLNTSLPGFVTPDAAYFPFTATQPLRDRNGSRSTVTAPTTRVFTNLTCTLPTITDSSGCSDAFVDPSFYYLDNGRGCKVPVYAYTADTNLTNTVLEYQSWHSSEWSDMGLDQAGCSCTAEFNSTFMAHLQPPHADTPNSRLNDSSQVAAISTDLFCTTGYWQHLVNLTVEIEGQAVIAYDSLQEPVAMDAQLFNTTYFEYIMATGPYVLITGAGGSLGALGTGNTDIFDAYIPEERTRLQAMYLNVDFGDVPLATYAFTDSVQPFTLYRDPLKLAAAWEGAHRFLFALAFNFAMKPFQDNARSDANYQVARAAIVLDETFAVLAEAILLSVAVLGSMLVFVASRQPSHLSDDPSSLVAVWSKASRSLQQMLELLDSHSDPTRDLDRNWLFKLDTSSRIVALRRLVATEPFRQAQRPNSEKHEYPLGLALTVQLSLLVAICGSVIGLVVLKQQVIKAQGIVVPTSNTFVTQLLLTYIPTAFSTSLEPMWVMLARDICFLAPFDTLSRGQAPARRTISANYTARPAQFNAAKALTRRHYLLAVFGINALLANVLHVAMGGLFVPREVTVQHLASFD